MHYLAHDEEAGASSIAVPTRSQMSIQRGAETTGTDLSGELMAMGPMRGRHGGGETGSHLDGLLPETTWWAGYVGQAAFG